MSKDIVKFELGQTVYRKILPDTIGMVTGILFRPNGCSYHVRFADETEEVLCWEIELTSEKEFATAHESEEKK